MYNLRMLCAFEKLSPYNISTSASQPFNGLFCRHWKFAIEMARHFFHTNAHRGCTEAIGNHRHKLTYTQQCAIFIYETFWVDLAASGKQQTISIEIFAISACVEPTVCFMRDAIISATRKFQWKKKWKTKLWASDESMAILCGQSAFEPNTIQHPYSSSVTVPCPKIIDKRNLHATKSAPYSMRNCTNVKSTDGTENFLFALKRIQCVSTP